MIDKQWNAFCNFKEKYKELCKKWGQISEKLYPLQKEAAKKDTPDYEIENSIVYNSAYEKITKDDEIKIIVIGDNPGKEEQQNNKLSYLVGQAGRIADGFFKRNSELNVDFRKNVLIMNKTPVHTAKTSHLKFVLKNGDSSVKKVLEESQRECAMLTAELQKNLGCKIWLVGYSELKEKRIFDGYRKCFAGQYDGDSLNWEKVFVYQHFSMNRFLVDLKEFREKNPQLLLEESLYKLGHLHRDEIFDCYQKR